MRRLSDDELWALELLDRANPWAARILRKRLIAKAEMPYGQMIDDIRQASRYLRDYINRLPVSHQVERRSVAELADRLLAYAMDLLNM